jgi:adenylate cyclase
MCLEGSVRRAAGRVRITAQMIDGANGGHVWADRYDRDMADIFDVQDEVTRTIVDALKVKLTSTEKAHRSGRARVNPEVYDLIVRARQTSLQLSAESAVIARTMLERAIELEPDWAIAYARLAVTTFAEYVNQWNGATSENLIRAMELARKAIALDDSEAYGHIALSICLNWQRRLEEAEAEARRAIELDPNSPDTYTALANALDFQGRHEEALPLYVRASRVDPQWDMALHFMGRALLALDRYDEAEMAFKKRLGLSPKSDMSRFYLAALYALSGRPDDARAMWSELLRVNPTFSAEHLNQTLPYRDPRVFGRLVDALRAVGIDVNTAAAV